MNNTTLIAALSILKENYTLSELEERLDMTPEDVQDGLMMYVESNQEKVSRMLREDLWMIET